MLLYLCLFKLINNAVFSLVFFSIEKILSINAQDIARPHFYIPRGSSTLSAMVGNVVKYQGLVHTSGITT